MPRLALVIAITISVLAPQQREAPSVAGARTFASLEGRFSISLPDRNGFGPLTIPTPFGNAGGSLYHWDTKEATFGVGYADAFQPLRDPEIAKQFFSSATDRFNKVATANSGAVATVKQITLDKHPGIEQRVDLFTGTVIQRTYIVSQRIYEIVAVIKNTQRVYESVALAVLDSFKVLTDADVQAQQAQEAAKAEPSPLPQTPVPARAGSDASDEGLRGNVRTVLTESQDLSGTWSVQGRKRNSFSTYNKEGNKIREERYDYRGNLSEITVYGYIDGNRVSTTKSIDHEYNPPPVRMESKLASSKKSDSRYGSKYEFKYDARKRLTEKTYFHSNGSVWLRYVYKYDGNKKEQLVYGGKGSSNQRYLSVLDGKGNEMETTGFETDGSVRYKNSFAYEFDAQGNWTRRTTSRIVKKDGQEKTEPHSVHFRIITYY